MKECLGALLVAIVYTASVYLGIDYLEMRHQIAHIKAQHDAHKYVEQQGDADNAANAAPGPEFKGHYAERNVHEHPEHFTEIAIAVGTGLIAWFTLRLFWDAKDKGRRELRAYIGL